MKNTQGINENRRENMRVDARLFFCISVADIIDEETGNYLFKHCYCSKTNNISLGGASFPLGRVLKVGDIIQLSTPEKTKRPSCLTCENAYLNTNGLELNMIEGRVVWVHGFDCGVMFTSMSSHNEAVLSKYFWNIQLESIRSEKENSILHRKF